MRTKRNLRGKIVTLLIMLAMFAIALPVYAAGGSDGGEETKKEYTVVTDNADLLTEDQIQNIESKVKNLTEYSAALYIENTEKSKCTQVYANKLSEKMYKKVFGDYQNGIIMVFSFYQESEWHYSVNYGSNVKIKESEVKDIVEGTYHQFDNDSNWVESSFCRCVNYFQSRENLPVTEKTSIEQAKSLTLTLIVILIFTNFIFIALWIKAEKTLERCRERLERAKRKLRENKKTIYFLEEDLERKTDENEELNKWYDNATDARPSIQQEIDEYLAKKVAEKFDDKYQELLELENSTENYGEFEDAVEHYEKLSKLEKKYVGIDIKKLISKREETAKVYAAAATDIIVAVCNEFDGIRDNIDELDSAMSYYRNLPAFVSDLLAEDVTSCLRSKCNDAHADLRKHQQPQKDTENDGQSEFIPFWKKCDSKENIEDGEKSDAENSDEER